MEHKIVEKEAFSVVGIGKDITVQSAPADCPVLWADFMKRYKEIKNYVGGMKNYGVCFTISETDCSMRYIACAEVSEVEDVPEGMESAEVPAGRYAVFEHRGKLESFYRALKSEIHEKGKE